MHHCKLLQAFLKHFIEDGVAWAHLDIAGPGMYSKARGHVPQGATGFGVQLIVEYLMQKEREGQEGAASEGI